MKMKNTQEITKIKNSLDPIRKSDKISPLIAKTVKPTTCQSKKKNVC